MTRYYFDIRDGDALFPDEEGVEMLGVEEAGTEAVRALASMAKETLEAQSMRELAIEVRDDDGPLLEVISIWRLQRKR